MNSFHKIVRCTLFLLSLSYAMVGCRNYDKEFDLSGDCEILALRLDTIDGTIDPITKSITVLVDKMYDCSLMTVTRLEISDGATCDVAVGDQLNMLSGRTLRVASHDVVQLWKLKVEKVREKIDNPKAVYMGLAEDYSQLNIEEQTACLWMLENIPQSTYASIAQIANGEIDLKDCKIIWWHLHKDGSINDRVAFESEAGVVMNAASRLKAFYQRGGNFFLTRYATYLPFYLGEAERFPNNCWGDSEQSATVVSGPWSFYATGHMDHPLYTGLVMDESDSTRIYTCDAGYSITNSTAQWKYGVDWSVYPDKESWRNATGAKDLAENDQAVVVWEYEQTENHGTILCIGSGCYDWYSKTGSSEYYHRNVAIMTQNAFDYLMK